MLPDLRRVLARVEVQGGHWLWTGWKNENGYGRTSVQGRVWPVHRWVYEQFRGPIPDGLEPDHLCRVRHCVNPDHIEPVTHAENMRRGTIWTAPKRMPKTRAPRPVRSHCKRGHAMTPANTVGAMRRCGTCRHIQDRATQIRRNKTSRFRREHECGIVECPYRAVAA